MRRVTAIAGWLVCCAACHSADAPPPEAPPSPEIAVERAPQRTARIEAQRGGMNQEEVERTFFALQPEVQACLERGSARLEPLGGSFTVTLRIKLDGSVRSAYLSSSTLGDRESERCVLRAASAAAWPRPKSGEGEVSHTYTFDGMVEVHTWDGKRMRSAMSTIMKKLWKCVSGVRGRFTATVYVRGDGRVMSAGVAPPSAAAEEKSDCIAETLTTFNFGRQPRRVSKVTFPIGF